MPFTTQLLDINLFVGRFHSLVVHLPIGFLLIVGIFFFLSKVDSLSYLAKALPLVLILTVVSSALAALTGWMLSKDGSYYSDIYSWHKWLGISIAVISALTLGWWTFKTEAVRAKVAHKITLFSIVLLLVIVSITGHLGGSLTHGEEYLFQYAPELIRNIAIADNDGEVRTIPEDPDSIVLYGHVIAPIIEQKCVTCHNEEFASGGLRLDTEEFIIKGGDHGEILAGGRPHESELFKRITLDNSERKYMPPSGDPLGYPEIKLIEYWISTGASFDQTIADKEAPADIKILLEERFGISDRMKTYVESTVVEVPDENVINELRSNGFTVNSLGDNTSLLEISTRKALTQDRIELLEKVAIQITWLDLSRTELNDELLDGIQDFENLTRLNLSSNEISDKAMTNISKLEHLEVLNLHSTLITDEVIKELSKLPELKSLYLWNTKVSNEAMEALKSELLDLVIDMGTTIKLAPRDSVST